eukprot:scaffold6859_cov100-Skeletonema_marinoi.AAC.2
MFEIGAFSAWCMSIYDSVDETKRRNYIISIIPQPLINFLYNECCQQDRSVHADGKRSRATIVRVKREKRERNRWALCWASITCPLPLPIHLPATLSAGHGRWAGKWALDNFGLFLGARLSSSHLPLPAPISQQRDGVTLNGTWDGRRSAHRQHQHSQRLSLLLYPLRHNENKSDYTR